MSTEALLGRGSNSLDFKSEEFGERPRAERSSWTKSVWKRRSVVVHLTIILCYTIVFYAVLSYSTRQYQHGPNLIYSPARGAVVYEKKFLNNDVNAVNDFKGKPRPELDAAWHNLLRNNNIRVTKDELDRMNRTSIQLADGSGDYLVAVDVFHHLHCLKMIRHYIHPEYYSMPQSLVNLADHVDHCLDAIRQELMCRAEVTFTTYDWLPNVSFPWAQLSYHHECVNFEAIDEWAGSRAIDIFDPKYLVHPTKGQSYPSSSAISDHRANGHVHGP